MTLSVLGDIADFATNDRSVPPVDVDTELSLCVADTIGVMIAGANQPVVSAVAEFVEASGGLPQASAVVGKSRFPVQSAALINGTAAHALDYDDATTGIVSGHLSAVLVPVVLAVGEHQGSLWGEALRAMALGYVTEVALARGVNPYHYERGFHPTATLGAFGAATAASVLSGLDSKACRNALALAASFASGIKANFGSMVKPLHAGWAAHNGVVAAAMAAGGVEGNPVAYEGPMGFARTFGNNSAAGRSVRACLSSPWDVILQTPLMRKRWPCCGSTHAAIAAVQRLRAIEDITPTSVVRVVCELDPRRVPHIDRPNPKSTNEARFSLQYCVALALVAESVADGPALRWDPSLANGDLIRRIEINPKGAASGSESTMDGSDFWTRVSIEVQNGSVYTEEIFSPPGSRDDPTLAVAMENKYVENTSDILPFQAAKESFEELTALNPSSEVRRTARSISPD